MHGFFAPATPEQTAAELRACAKLGVIRHALTYLLVMALLVAVNLVSRGQHLWFVWPLLGWGFGLLSHALGVFVFGRGTRLRERLVDREMRHGA